MTTTSDEFRRFMTDADDIADYLYRQVKQGAISGALDKQRIGRFLNSLEEFKKKLEDKE